MVPMLKKLPGYALVPLVTLQRFTHTIVPLTKHQVKYRAAWDAMFECAILHLQKLAGSGYDSRYCMTHHRSFDVFSDCRLSLVMWVTSLKTIDNTSELEMAIKARF